MGACKFVCPFVSNRNLPFLYCRLAVYFIYIKKWGIWVYGLVFNGIFKIETIFNIFVYNFRFSELNFRLVDLKI